MKIRKMPLPGGGEVPVRDVEFEPVTEPWCVYKLTDGGTVRIRATALVISRLLDPDGKPAYMPDGQPSVWVQHNVTIVASE